jgi:hypothetical protein
MVLVPLGVGHGEITEALLSLLRDEVVDLVPGTTNVRLLERL